MAQPYQANVGNYPNDGEGAPIRSAFTGYNENFVDIYAAGPVGSNLSIANNTIQSNNLNGDIRLWTNGTGQVVLATNMIPDQDRTRSLGTPTNRYRSVYVQNINAAEQAVTGNLRVTGNLQVTGNLSYTNVSNLNVANTLITLANGAVSPVDANGGGLFLAGANAGFVYAVSDNSWHSNISTVTQGNVTSAGGYFIGDGGLLSNVSASAAAALVTGSTLSGNVTFSSLTTVGTLANLQVANFVYAGYYIGDGGNLSNISANNITGTVGNSLFSTYSGTANRANVADIATLAINADNALYALDAATAERATWAANANIAQHAVFSDAASTANTASIASAALLVTGNNQPYITSVGTLSNLAVTGGTHSGGVYTDNYFYANGVPVSFTGAQYGDGNVELLLSSGNVTTIDASGTISAGGSVISHAVQTTNIQTTGLTVYGATTVNGLNSVANITTQGVLTDNYYYANGVPIDFGNSNYGNSNVETLLSDGINTNIETSANVSGNNLSFSNLYVGNTLFTRTLVVGTRTTPVTVPLASNNTFNVLTRSAGNVSVYTS